MLSKQVSGLTFIEVLVSLFLLSVMILSLAAVQLTALREAKMNYWYSVAAQQIINLHEITTAMHASDETAIVRWSEQTALLLPRGQAKKISAKKILIHWGNRSEPSCTNNVIGSSGCLFGYL